MREGRRPVDSWAKQPAETDALRADPLNVLLQSLRQALVQAGGAIDV